MNSFPRWLYSTRSQKPLNALLPKKKQLLYPDLSSFLRFSDSTQFHIPKLLKYANSDSSLFNSDESASNDELLRKLMTPSTTSNYDCPTPSSNDNSPIKLYDNSLFKQIIKTPEAVISIDRSRRLSQDQSNLLPHPMD